MASNPSLTNVGSEGAGLGPAGRRPGVAVLKGPDVRSAIAYEVRQTGHCHALVTQPLCDRKRPVRARY